MPTILNTITVLRFERLSHNLFWHQNFPSFLVLTLYLPFFFVQFWIVGRPIEFEKPVFFILFMNLCAEFSNSLIGVFKQCCEQEEINTEKWK